MYLREGRLSTVLHPAPPPPPPHKLCGPCIIKHKITIKFSHANTSSKFKNFSTSSFAYVFFEIFFHQGEWANPCSKRGQMLLFYWSIIKIWLLVSVISITFDKIFVIVLIDLNVESKCGEDSLIVREETLIHACSSQMNWNPIFQILVLSIVGFATFQDGGVLYS